MNIGKIIIAGLFIVLSGVQAQADNLAIKNLTISKIRAVGNYAGSTFDNTIEIWFTTPLSWPSESACTGTSKVYVDTKHAHIISAAYLALASSKKVKVNVDTDLPVRNGSCEVSYLDVDS